MDNLLQGVRDPNLKFTLAFGVGLHHAGLHERDRKTVEELFVNQKIHVSLCVHNNVQCIYLDVSGHMYIFIFNAIM